MNRTVRTNGRNSRTGANAGKGGGYRSQAQSRTGAAGRSGGYGRRPAARQGEFALPVTITPALPPAQTFAHLDMPAPLLAALNCKGVTVPFPIQAATLPNSLAGRDVLGRGRTGSGKTLAFGLALLARTAGQRAEPRQPLALVLVPTRELAQQVTDALTPYARSLRLRLTTVVGGMSIGRQANALRDGAEVVVATAGRLKDLIERGDCRLDRVGITVLDEADQMADMGFMPQVTELLDQVRPDGQRMLFSATLDRNVDLLVRCYLHDPVVHSVDPSAGAVTTMEHHVLHVHGADKYATTTEIAARDGRVIMFLDTKHAVDALTKHLLKSGVRAAALHGGKSQPQRTRTLDQFKTGHVTVLVATNVAARGIHVDHLDLVVNVDPPSDHKDYLHRGGRTARAGESGSVVTLVLPNQRRDMDRLMTDAGITPQTTQVRSGEAELSRITGAQTPSGVPVTITAPVVERAKSGASSSRGRRSRPAQARRSAGSPRSAAGTSRPEVFSRPGRVNPRPGRSLGSLAHPVRRLPLMLVQTCLRQTNRSTRTAGDAMRPPGPQVCNDMFVDAALSVLISARTRHLVICDEDGRCTGLVTRTQLTAHRSTPWYTDVTRLRVTSFHDRGPFTLSATLLHDAERTMRDRALCDSPVVDDEGYVLGVLAFSH